MSYCKWLSAAKTYPLVKIWTFSENKNWDHFYQRPVLSSGIVVACVCLCVRVSERVCITHLLVCAITRDPFKHRNTTPVQARITKFVQDVLHTWVKISVILGGYWPWPSRSNLTLKSTFLVSPLLETHNHHITAGEPGVPRLLHRPDRFMISILCMYLCT